MDIHTILWIVFICLFILVFTIDMYVTDHRKGKIKVRTALTWTAVWITTALLFSSAIYLYYPEGKTRAFEFITGYLIEYSLSVDNLFVFILIFTMMGIKEKNQPRILKWGIIGAVVLRILFIVAGVELIKAFHFMIYLLGAVLVFTAIKMFASKEEEIHPDHNLFVKIAKKLFKIKTDVGSDHFFIKENGQLYATVAFITVVLLESTDLVFAVDSIPAVLAITQDSFIAITSNLSQYLVCVHYSLRLQNSEFIPLSEIWDIFHPAFIGVKMLISGWIVISVQTSLIVILATLVTSILASVIIKEEEETDHHSFHEHLQKKLRKRYSSRSQLTVIKNPDQKVGIFFCE
ncbi:MAG: TerC/Alx family metal homeostasis membrane protein [Ignavibacteriales bacterium]|nr:TerC/Alx family metal homeostasis membrane protein [Ignavibacteriales bacterium]